MMSDTSSLNNENKRNRQVSKTQQEMDKRDSLLTAVNRVASLLLHYEGDFDNTVWKCLGILGECMEVDRVYVWENHILEGKLCTTQIYEWSEGAPPQQGNELTVAVPLNEVAPTWEGILSENNCINSHVKDMVPEEQEQLGAQGIVSILVVPIFMNNSFWGFIGFDECKHERVFLAFEEKILRSGGLLIASAMERNVIMENLIAAKEEAMSSAQAKSMFLANMSHEIRTPLNAVIGFTTVARNTDDHEKIQNCLTKIDTASRHLLSLINAVLDMSKIEARKFDLSLEPFRLRTMIYNVCSIIRNRTDEKKQSYIVNIATDIPDSFVGDEMRLFQVLTNLLGNAVKFTPEGGEIRLEIMLVSQNTDSAEIRFIVEDNGIGISPQQIKTLFAAFEQADRGTSKRFEGTGLGLAISKNIIELMGGSIEVESEPETGSRFTFSICLPRTDDAVFKEEEEKPAADFSGHTILLVEDVEVNREIVQALLENSGIEIECAENGEAAVEMVKADPERYDMIYMDIQMPVLDGFEATRQIRALGMGNTATVPIIAMTANAFAEDIAKCKAYGMDDHIAKPIDMNLVLQKTAKYIKN